MKIEWQYKNIQSIFLTNKTGKTIYLKHFAFILSMEEILPTWHGLRAEGWGLRAETRTTTTRCPTALSWATTLRSRCGHAVVILWSYRCSDTKRRPAKQHSLKNFLGEIFKFSHVKKLNWNTILTARIKWRLTINKNKLSRVYLVLFAMDLYLYLLILVTLMLSLDCSNSYRASHTRHCLRRFSQDWIFAICAYC